MFYSNSFLSFFFFYFVPSLYVENVSVTNSIISVNMKETNIDRKRIWRRKRKECRRIFGNEKKKKIREEKIEIRVSASLSF